MMLSMLDLNTIVTVSTACSQQTRTSDGLDGPTHGRRGRLLQGPLSVSLP